MDTHQDGSSPDMSLCDEFPLLSNLLDTMQPTSTSLPSERETARARIMRPVRQIEQEGSQESKRLVRKFSALYSHVVNLR